MFKVIAVDDEKMSLKNIMNKLNKMDEISSVDGFNDPNEALSFVEKNDVDIAFLDVEMYGINGIELAAEIKQLKPDTSIIFLTGFSNYAVDAFKVRASGYLLKPASIEDIKKEINHIKESHLSVSGSSGLRVQTFGNFEVFYNDEPLKFSRSKSKELFAYLIDRKGAACTNGELISVLWEDKGYDASTASLLRNVVSDILHTLKEIGQEDIIVKQRNNIYVLCDKIDCDYYKFLDGDADAVNSYAGEYMMNYSWAEFTTAFLDNKTM